MKTEISNEKIIKFIKGLLTFPHPQVCRHYVATNLMSLLEANGWIFSTEFIDAVICAEDKKALELLASEVIPQNQGWSKATNGPTG